MNRSQQKLIIKDLDKKMVFLVGPRQSGKTWLAKEIAKSFKQSVYLNYDSREDRKIIEKESWLPSTDLLILDELHKKQNWKNYLKGVFDTKPKSLRILVTGSARLDAFKQVGDSLAGRYFTHHLLPFSPAEFVACGIKNYSMDDLIERSGFPEPYLADNAIDAKRWRSQYIEDMIGVDVLNFENITNMKAFKTVFELLREKVGSPVSIASIVEDAAISPATVKKYIQVLEALYIVFVVRPHSNNIARSLLKEPKIYFFDPGLVKAGDGAQLENFVAVSLLKHVYSKIDYAAENYNLCYCRTKDQREIDFVLTKDKKIVEMIEVKSSDNALSPALIYFHERYAYPGVQIVRHLKHQRKEGKLSVRAVQDYLETLA